MSYKSIPYKFGPINFPCYKFFFCAINFENLDLDLDYLDLDLDYLDLDLDDLNCHTLLHKF